MCELNTMTAEQVVATYIRLRDQKAELKAKQAEELKPYDEALFKIEQHMLNTLQSAGMESTRTASGTAYIMTRSSVSVADKSAFLDHVKANMDFDLLDIKANKTAVEAYLANKQELPPGVNIRRDITVGFRRA